MYRDVDVNIKIPDDSEVIIDDRTLSVIKLPSGMVLLFRYDGNHGKVDVEVREPRDGEIESFK